MIIIPISKYTPFQTIMRIRFLMMTSPNGNIFRVTGPLCGEFTGPGEFPTQRPVTRSFDVFFDLRLNKRLSIQPWDWWFETPSWSLWRQCNVLYRDDTMTLTPAIPIWTKCNEWMCSCNTDAGNIGSYTSLSTILTSWTTSLMDYISMKRVWANMPAISDPWWTKCLPIDRSLSGNWPY